MSLKVRCHGDETRSQDGLPLHQTQGQHQKRCPAVQVRARVLFLISVSFFFFFKPLKTARLNHSTSLNPVGLFCMAVGARIPPVVPYLEIFFSSFLPPVSNQVDLLSAAIHLFNKSPRCLYKRAASSSVGRGGRKKKTTKFFSSSKRIDQVGGQTAHRFLDSLRGINIFFFFLFWGEAIETRWWSMTYGQTVFFFFVRNFCIHSSRDSMENRKKKNRVDRWPLVVREL